VSREIGLLTTRGHPLLPTILEALEHHPTLVPVLFADAKGLPAADLARFGERTSGAFPRRDVLREVIEVPDHNGPELRAVLRARGISLLANAGTPRHIGTDLLAAVDGIVNAHPGILPKYRGASCAEWAIFNGDPVGVTVHFMDEGLDSGPIISTATLDIDRRWDYVAMRVALYRLEARVLAEGLDRVVRDHLRPDGLPAQPPSAPFRPIPDDLLAVVKQRLARGEYAHAR
jgi:methionyl-tRNA formyltransferase